MIALALALLAVQGPSPASQSARAESLLSRGDVQGALKVARKIVERRPDDAQAHFLLGRAHYDRAVIGRWPALEEFKKAARLAPNDPAPLYWQMKVGFYLRSDDGDRIARDALLQLFASILTTSIRGRVFTMSTRVRRFGGRWSGRWRAMVRIPSPSSGARRCGSRWLTGREPTRCSLLRRLVVLRR